MCWGDDTDYTIHTVSDNDATDATRKYPTLVEILPMQSAGTHSRFDTNSSNGTY